MWSGRAAEGRAGGAYVRDVSWQFVPGALLSGQLAFRTSSNPGAGTMLVEVAVSPNGALTLSDLSGGLPLDLVHPAFQQNGIRGDVTLQFTRIVILDGVPIAADGSVTVSDFFVRDLSASQIGDFRAEFQSTDGGIVGSVEDTSGVLDVAGTVSLNPDRSYSFTGLVAATATAPPSVVSSLQFLGSANAQGQHEFRFEGQL